MQYIRMDKTNRRKRVHAHASFRGVIDVLVHVIMVLRSLIRPETNELREEVSENVTAVKYIEQTQINFG